jgi:hypothetical protein
MISSTDLQKIVAEARPIISRQLDDAEQIAALRKLGADKGGDWSALKALVKAQEQDHRDGSDKHVQKILEKTDFASAYADMLGLNLNETNNSGSDE